MYLTVRSEALRKANGRCLALMERRNEWERHSKEEDHVVDDFCDSGGSLATRHGEFLYIGRLYSPPAGYCCGSGFDPGDSGKIGSMTIEWANHRKWRPAAAEIAHATPDLFYRNDVDGALLSHIE